MYLLDDGLARSTSTTSANLKSSDPVYTVKFINTFYHFIISNMANVYEWMPLLTSTQVMGTSNLIETLYL